MLQRGTMGKPSIPRIVHPILRPSTNIQITSKETQISNKANGNLETNSLNSPSKCNLEATELNDIIKTHSLIQTPKSELNTENRPLLHSVSSMIFDLNNVIFFDVEPKLKDFDLKSINTNDFNSLFIKKCTQLKQVCDFSNFYHNNNIINDNKHINNGSDDNKHINNGCDDNKHLNNGCDDNKHNNNGRHDDGIKNNKKNEIQMEEKLKKEEMLKDMLTIVKDQRYVALLKEEEYNALFQMFRRNVIRATPPIPAVWFAPIVSIDFTSDRIEENGWLHLNLLYDIMINFLSNWKFNPQLCPKNEIKKLLKGVIFMFQAPDQRERDKLMKLFHSLYREFKKLRTFCRTTSSEFLKSALNAPSPRLGVAEMLSAFVPIIAGFKVPVHEENIIFFKNILIPLHISPHIHMFYNSLINAVSTFLKKCPKEVVAVYKVILDHWPVSSITKQILFLNEIEHFFEILTQISFLSYNNNSEISSNNKFNNDGNKSYSYSDSSYSDKNCLSSNDFDSTSDECENENEETETETFNKKKLNITISEDDKVSIDSIVLKLCQILAFQCISSDNFTVAERSLMLWESDYFIHIISCMFKATYPILVPVIYKTASAHWCEDVRALALNSMRVLKGKRFDEFEKIGKNFKKMENEKIMDIMNRGTVWLKIIDQYYPSNSNTAINITPTLNNNNKPNSNHCNNFNNDNTSKPNKNINDYYIKGSNVDLKGELINKVKRLYVGCELIGSKYSDAADKLYNSGTKRNNANLFNRETKEEFVRRKDDDNENETDLFMSVPLKKTISAKPTEVEPVRPCAGVPVVKRKSSNSGKFAAKMTMAGKPQRLAITRVPRSKAPKLLK